MRIFLFCLLSTVSITLSAIGNDKLASGPMQGYTTPTTTKVWIMVKQAGIASVTLRDTNTNEVFTEILKTKDFTEHLGHHMLTFSFVGLRASTNYQCTIHVDGETYDLKRSIKTAKSDPAEPYSFIVTSCAISLPVGLRWLHPGIEDRVFKFAIKEGGDFSLWLGDYLYYRPFLTSDMTKFSSENMYKQWIEKRKKPKIQAFMESMPQYAMWDDHDFGPNNSDSSFVLKKTALQIYEDFFPNPQNIDKPVPGNYFHFTYLDSEIFMTDGRTYRTPETEEHPQMLGPEQIEWLQQKLLASKATFKFVGFGSQVLNTCSVGECLWKYQDELQTIMNFVIANKIEGVIFMSGDRHHSELLRMDYSKDSYPFYEFTSSGITSFRRRTRRTSEKMNPTRVGKSLADFQNYGKIFIEGEPGDKTLTFKIFRKRGKLFYEHTIHEDDLKFAK